MFNKFPMIHQFGAFGTRSLAMSIKNMRFKLLIKKEIAAYRTRRHIMFAHVPV